jgi:hypothetical protein
MTIDEGNPNDLMMKFFSERARLQFGRAAKVFQLCNASGDNAW